MKQNIKEIVLFIILLIVGLLLFSCEKDPIDTNIITTVDPKDTSEWSRAEDILIDQNNTTDKELILVFTRECIITVNGQPDAIPPKCEGEATYTTVIDNPHYIEPLDENPYVNMNGIWLNKRGSILSAFEISEQGVKYSRIFLGNRNDYKNCWEYDVHLNNVIGVYSSGDGSEPVINIVPVDNKQFNIEWDIPSTIEENMNPVLVNYAAKYDYIKSEVKYNRDADNISVRRKTVSNTCVHGITGLPIACDESNNYVRTFIRVDQAVLNGTWPSELGEFSFNNLCE